LLEDLTAIASETSVLGRFLIIKKDNDIAVVLVTWLDRLARSTRDLPNILDNIGQAGAQFKIAARDLG
jgi:DNA invertase Pin-like site-specific DNA recombinase